MPKENSGESLNVNNIKRLQEKALLWRMWAIGLSFVIPAVSIGTSMAFSVVGYDFYVGQRNLDGTDVNAGENAITDADVETTTEGDSHNGTNFTQDEATWFVSVLSLTIMIGTLLSGSVIENIGCLWTLRLGMIIELGGWISIIVGQFSFTPVFVGRIFSGFGCGLTLPAAYMLLSDVSIVRYRGIFAVLNSSACNVGFLIGLVVGAWCSFPVILVSCVSASVSFLIISIFLPESPLWLIKKGQDERALKIIQRIRGTNYPANVEAKEIYACVNAQWSDEPFFRKMAKYALSRQFLRPLSTMLVIAAVQGTCGVDAISYYCVTLFRMANLAVDEYIMAIFMQIGYTAGYIIIAPFMDSIDRKRLYSVASWFMAISLVVLGATINPEEESEASNAGNSTLHHNISSTTLPGVIKVADFDGNLLDVPTNGSSLSHNFVSDGNAEDDEAKWFHILLQMTPCISVVVFTFSYGAGFGPAIYTWTSEVFPSNLKGVGSSLALASRNIVVFIVLKLYPGMISDLGLSKVFWMHASVMMFGIVFVYFAMPETRGLTLTQLNEVFGGKVSYDRASISDGGSSSPDDFESGVNYKEGRSAITNSVMAKVASTAALSKAASTAAMSRVASLAVSVGGRGKDNNDDDYVELLKPQLSSEENSDVEFSKVYSKMTNDLVHHDAHYDSDEQDGGMTMAV